MRPIKIPEFKKSVIPIIPKILFPAKKRDREPMLVNIMGKIKLVFPNNLEDPL